MAHASSLQRNWQRDYVDDVKWIAHDTIQPRMCPMSFEAEIYNYSYTILSIKQSETNPQVAVTIL